MTTLLAGGGKEQMPTQTPTATPIATISLLKASPTATRSATIKATNPLVKTSSWKSWTFSFVTILLFFLLLIIRKLIIGHKKAKRIAEQKNI